MRDAMFISLLLLAVTSVACGSASEPGVSDSNVTGRDAGESVVDEGGIDLDSGAGYLPNCWGFLKCSCVEGRPTAAPVPDYCKADVAQQICETYVPCDADGGR